jgi:hypothetical protein
MASKIQLRRDTASNWTSNNTVLSVGEPGYEIDTGFFKIGAEGANWNDLPYAGGLGSGPDGQLYAGDGTTDAGDTNSIAIGTDAGIGQSTATIAIGHEAGNSGQDRSGIAIGRGAGKTDQGRSSIAIGRRAGSDDQSEEVIAIGYYAGYSEQRYHAIAIGAEAGNDQQSYSAVAIGNHAGNYNQGTTSIAIGSGAGNEDQQDEAVAVGAYAGNENQGQHAVAVGYEAGNYEQGWAAVAIGEQAGQDNQGFRAVAVGRWAGDQDQGDQAVAVGALAGRYSQGDKAVAVGRHAGQDNQGEYAIAIGQEAGAGSTADSGDYLSKTWVSGGLSGETTFVVDNVTDIMTGMQAVGTNLSNCFVTAINTGTNEITISPGTSGDIEGHGPINFYGRQGDYSIAIGAYASSRHQHSNSVVINASGAEVNSAGSGTVVIKTVRSIAAADAGTLGFLPCAYNSTTGELVYITA